MEHSENFVANVQYDDWTGTVAADNYGSSSEIKDWLKQEGKIDGDESVCGIELTILEGHLYLSAYIFKREQGRTFAEIRENSDPISLTKLDLHLSLEDFLHKFKRFRINMSSGGCLTNRKVKVTSLDH